MTKENPFTDGRSILSRIKPTREYEKILKHLENSFGFDELADVLFTAPALTSSNFPPYNVYANDFSNVTKFVIEMAVAGYSKDNVKVSIEKLNDTQKLRIEGEARAANPYLSQGYNVTMTQNMAGRSFCREFILSPTVVVNLVEMKDGMLNIFLEKHSVAKQAEYLEIK